MIPAASSPIVNSPEQQALSAVQDNTLVAALKSRGEKAINTLHQTYSAALFGIIRRIVQDDEGADNVLKLTLSKVVQSIDQYDAAKLRLFTWMVGFARQYAAEELVQQEAIQLAEEKKYPKSGEVTLKVVYAAGETHDNKGLAKLADAMEPRYRMMLNLIYFQGFSVEEIAGRFSLPVQEVKLRLAIAIRQLRAGCTHQSLN